MEITNVMTLGAWKASRVLTKDSKCWERECITTPKSSIAEKRIDNSKIEYWNGRARTPCVI